MLEDLIEAKAADTKLRNELQALKRDNERLSAELAQALTRRIELERSSELAETRIAELTKAVDTARREAARIDEDLTRLRGQNGKLNHSLARADATRKAALAEAEKARAGLARTREAATHAAAQSKADLAGLLEELNAKDQELAAAKSAPEEGESYTVRSGETLWAIALRHGVGLSALAQANGIDEPYRIYAGQKLRIPDGEAASTATGALRPHPPA